MNTDSNSESYSGPATSNAESAWSHFWGMISLGIIAGVFMLLALWTWYIAIAPHAAIMFGSGAAAAAGFAINDLVQFWQVLTTKEERDRLLDESDQSPIDPAHYGIDTVA